MNNTIFVTGASSGLGMSVCKHFANLGWNVVASMRNTEKGLIYKEYKNVFVVSLDVTKLEMAENAMKEAVDKYGKIDVLFNAAGYGGVFLFEDKDDNYFKAQMDTNFYGTVNTTRAVIPYMREKRSGHIINVTSIAGKAGIPFQSAYVASKHAVSGFTDSLAYEVKNFGINMTIFEVGGMNTGFVKAMDNAEEVSINDYKEYFERVSTKLESATIDAYKNAPSSDMVAKKVEKLVNMSSPPVFFRPTSDSRIMEIIRRVFPRKHFRNLMKMGLE
ncbi:MAG: SDR family oxidoreductase [Firmicutes bacterium]|jgi:NAD(P)-dependent dehydrogenase (short-subunit alcohol dehydrogenase family)|nr:SDR family oxidoreductase [Bacillota bacterium]